ANVESPARGTAWKLPRSHLPEGRTLVMGIVNATPDSFSDGGAYDPIAQGLKLAEDGADIIDVGGESTRPNASPVDAVEERRRTEHVVRELSRRTGLPISIDTTKAAVAAPALDAGAEIVNDVSGLARDPELFRAASGAAVCLMHMRGTPADMQSRQPGTKIASHFRSIQHGRPLGRETGRACAQAVRDRRNPRHGERVPDDRRADAPTRPGRRPSDQARQPSPSGGDRQGH